MFDRRAGARDGRASITTKRVDVVGRRRPIAVDCALSCPLAVQFRCRWPPELPAPSRHCPVSVELRDRRPSELPATTRHYPACRPPSAADQRYLHVDNACNGTGLRRRDHRRRRLEEGTWSGRSRCQRIVSVFIIMLQTLSIPYWQSTWMSVCGSLCMYVWMNVCMSMSASLSLNISETKGDSGRVVPYSEFRGKCPRGIE